MLTVIAENKFKEDKIDVVKEIINKLIEQTLKEDGCIKYDIVQSTTNNGHLTMIEEWDSLESLQNHGVNPEFLKLANELTPFAEQVTQMTIYKEFLWTKQLTQ